MDTRIVDRPAFLLVGHAAQVPLIHRCADPHIANLVVALPPEGHVRLKSLSNTEPAGLLQISDDVDPTPKRAAR